MNWFDLSRFQFDTPAVLWLLVLVPLVGLLRERSVAGHAPWRTLGAMILRGLALIALLLAAAGPFEEQTRPDRSMAVVLDGSASVHALRRDRARAWIQDLEARRGDVRAVFVVAGPVPLLFDDAEGALAAFGTRPTDQGTDLQAALEVALARLPAARVREVVLLTDGAVTRGTLEPTLRVASARDVPVHVVPLLDRTPLLEVVDVVPTQDLLVGDEVPVQVVVRTNAPGDAELVVTVGDREVARAAATLPLGLSEHRLSFVAESAGILDLAVSAGSQDARADHPARLRVRPRPAALIVGDKGSDALRAAVRGYEPALDVSAMPSLPEGPYDDWSLVVLLDPNLPALGRERIVALRDYVRDGGRLLVTGGENGLVTDEEVVAPLAAALPVKFPKRKKKQRAPLAVIYCLDTSDSMAGGAKFELAAAALAQSLYLLPDSARVGVIGFADFPTWIVPLDTFVGSANVIDALAAVQVRGGTSIYHALQDGYDALRSDEALVKHVVLLSDGQSTTTFARSGDIVTSMKKRDITVTTIAVTADSDRPEMERISKAGGGRAYYTESFTELPKLFLDEMMEVTRTNKVDESFVVHPVEGSPMLARVPEGTVWPELDGFVRGEQKAGSALALATGDGRPVLVQGRFGRGQVTLFASDIGGSWSDDWVGWKGLAPLWEGTVEAILRPEPPLRVALDVRVEGAQAQLRFSAQDDLKNPRSDLVVEAVVHDPVGQPREIALLPVGPGRYGVDIGLAQGATLLRVSAVGVDRPGAPPPPGGELLRSVAPTPPEELRGARANEALLRRIAEATNGQSSPAAADLLDRTVAERVDRMPRWTWPLYAALVLLLLDLGWRRIRLASVSRV